MFFSFALQAQNSEPDVVPKPKDLSYEFGFNLYSLTDLRRAPFYSEDDLNKYVFDQNYFSGIYFKKHFRKNCLRASFDLYRKTINDYLKSSSNPFFFQNNGQKVSGNFRLGYEREFSTKKLVPYVSADLVYVYSESKGYTSAYGDFSSHYHLEYRIKQYEFAVSMGTGLKLKLSKNLQLSYELSGQIGRVNSKTVTTDNEIRYGATVLRFNPVRQFGLSILF